MTDGLTYHQRSQDQTTCDDPAQSETVSEGGQNSFLDRPIRQGMQSRVVCRVGRCGECNSVAGYLGEADDDSVVEDGRVNRKTYQGQL